MSALFRVTPLQCVQLNAKKLNTRVLCSKRGYFPATQVRHHKNFGHKIEPTPLFTKIWYTIVGGGIIVSLLDWKKFYKYWFPPKDNKDISGTSMNES